jgi:hypothetical protein
VGSLIAYGSSSSGGAGSNFLTPNAISTTGRFVVGMGYVCTYNSAGTTVSANSFRWRPWIWDAQANAGAGGITILPTPFKTTSGQTSLRRTGNAYAVSSDGLVIAGAQEHNFGTTPTADPDGGRLVVWRWNAVTSTYDMTFLPNGVNGSGFPITYSTTPSSLAMNAAGTIIVCRAIDNSSNAYLGKWLWNAGTSSWDPPINIGSNIGATKTILTITCASGVATVTTSTDHGLAVNDKVYIAGNSTATYNGLKTVTNVPSTTTFEYSVTCVADGTGGTANKAASWLPFAVTSCGAPPEIGLSLAMTDDGNTVVGQARYSTCGSFMSQGFIWHNSDNVIQDWYDYNVAKCTPGCSSSGFWGPIGDPTPGDGKGQPVLGSPNRISPDGSAIVGRQGGNQVIPGAPPWIWQASGGPACVAPTITSNPAATTNFTACSSSIILNAAASGTPPLSYRWYKGATPLNDGPTGFGSNYTGTTSFQFRITPPSGSTLSASEAGTYYCVVTGICGDPPQTAQTTNAVVQTDPAYPPAANDTCAGATVVNQGTNVLSPAPSVCTAYQRDPSTGADCAVWKADLWYKFTPTTTGNYRLETCGSSSFDTVLSVFDGCGGNQVACNDDFVTGPACGSGTTRSRILSVGLTASTLYYIQVSAKSTAFLSSSYTYNLSIFPAPVPPANDSCSSPSAAAVGPNSFDTTEATNDATVSCSTAASRDVWFEYTPPTWGLLTAATCPGTTWNTVLSLHNGTCGGELACNDNIATPAPTGCTTSAPSLIAPYPVNGATPYEFRVGSTSTTIFGAGTLNVAFFYPGDMNCDGAVNGLDIQHFVQALIDPTGYTNDHDGSPYARCNALAGDFNRDGFLTEDDIPGFVSLLVGP